MSWPGHGLTRRSFTRVGALGAAGLALGSASAGQTPSTELRSRLLMEMELDIAEDHVVDPRRIVPVTGGRFSGPRLNGVALAGGGDWLISRPDGTRELHVRATLQTDDKQLIYMWSRGIVHTPAGGETYWRTTPVFETASDRYSWLNRLIAVGVGRRAPLKAVYRVFEIL